MYRYKTDIYKHNYCSRECSYTGLRLYSKGINIGEKNGQWKGKDVSYKALHDYIKCHLSKSSQCQKCNEDKPLDLANKSGKYKRDLKDWCWLCRSCHMKSDGRLEKLLAISKKLNKMKSLKNGRYIKSKEKEIIHAT